MIDERVLIERLEETEQRLLENSVGVDCTIGIVNSMERAKNIVNQLAEEMDVSKMENTNNDFCEWKCESGYPKMMAVWNTSCDRKRFMQKTDGERYCTYCGKKIKVVE